MRVTKLVSRPARLLEPVVYEADVLDDVRDRWS
jgi:hypothetical protein